VQQENNKRAKTVNNLLIISKTASRHYNDINKSITTIICYFHNAKFIISTRNMHLAVLYLKGVIYIEGYMGYNT